MPLAVGQGLERRPFGLGDTEQPRVGADTDLYLLTAEIEATLNALER